MVKFRTLRGVQVVLDRYCGRDGESSDGEETKTDLSRLLLEEKLRRYEMHCLHPSWELCKSMAIMDA